MDSREADAAQIFMSSSLTRSMSKYKSPSKGLLQISAILSQANRIINTKHW